MSLINTQQKEDWRVAVFNAHIYYTSDIHSTFTFISAWSKEINKKIINRLTIPIKIAGNLDWFLDITIHRSLFVDLVKVVNHRRILHQIVILRVVTINRLQQLNLAWSVEVLNLLHKNKKDYNENSYTLNWISMHDFSTTFVSIFDELVHVVSWILVNFRTSFAKEFLNKHNYYLKFFVDSLLKRFFIAGHALFHVMWISRIVSSYMTIKIKLRAISKCHRTIAIFIAFSICLGTT